MSLIFTADLLSFRTSEHGCLVRIRLTLLDSDTVSHWKLDQRAADEKRNHLRHWGRVPLSRHRLTVISLRCFDILWFLQRLHVDYSILLAAALLHTHNQG